MQHLPQDIVRHTVEQNGGTYTTDAADLLGLFGRENLTDKARAELTTALLDVGVGVEPHLFRVERDELVHLFLLDSERVAGPARGAGSVPSHRGGQHRPQDIARKTVEQYGGSHTTNVASLLGLFGRENLTDKARAELTMALRDVGLAVEPDLFHVERDDLVNLFPVDSDPVPDPAVCRPTVVPATVRSRRRRLVPRTWKGWLAYGVLALFVVAALTGDPDDGDSGGSAAPSSNDVAPQTDKDEDVQADAQRLRRERAEQRRKRARAQRARRRRAAARRELERREALAERREQERQQTLAEQRRQDQEEEQRQQDQEESQCHPSYDPCLDPNASDYDCEGGSGDGPSYTGPVAVSGDDPYDLDRDGDGSACE